MAGGGVMSPQAQACSVTAVRDATGWQGQGWLLSCLYYERDAADPWFDARFERLAVDLLPPLLRALRAAEPEARILWMRYSERGSHLRLQVWGGEPALTAHVRPLIERAVARLRADAPQRLGQHMALTEMGRRLNERCGTLGSQRAAGSHDIGWVGREGEEAVYADRARFDFVQAQLEREAMDSLQVLALGRPPGWRLRYWQNYAAQLLQRLGLGDAQSAIGLGFLARTWQQTFGIGAADLHGAQVPVQADPAVQDCPPLPGGTAAIAAWRDQPVALWAMQLLGLLHLCANRLGVSIIDEIRHAQATARAAWHRLGADERAGVRAALDQALCHWRTAHARH